LAESVNPGFDEELFWAYNVFTRLIKFKFMIDTEDIKKLTKYLTEAFKEVFFTKEDWQKLELKVDKIETDLSAFQTNIPSLKTDVPTLKTDVSVLKTDVSCLKSDVSVLKTDVSILKVDVSGLKADVFVLKEDVTIIKGNTQNLETKIDKVQTSLDAVLKDKQTRDGEVSVLNYRMEKAEDFLDKPSSSFLEVKQTPCILYT